MGYKVRWNTGDGRQFEAPVTAPGQVWVAAGGALRINTADDSLGYAPGVWESFMIEKVEQ
jgi:hypothetical protein